SLHTEHAPEHQNITTLQKSGPTVRRLFPTEPARPDPPAPATATATAGPSSAGPSSAGPAHTRPTPPARADDRSATTAADQSTATAADALAHTDAAVKRAAHGVIRIAFEVIDGRRPPERARGVFTEPIVDMLRVLARESVPGRKLGPARVQR